MSRYVLSRVFYCPTGSRRFVPTSWFEFDHHFDEPPLIFGVLDQAADSPRRV
jgi:hypothetical protein